MTTARSMIYAALGEIGAYGDEETPDAAAVNAALAVLNRMWGGWSATLGVINAETLDSLTLIAGQAVYSIGSSGGADFAVARPVNIKAAQFRFATNSDQPIDVITYDAYQAIIDKATTSPMVEALAYNATFPLGQILVWPVPSVAGVVRLTSLKVLAAFDLDTVLDTLLPPGYENAIVPNLAIYLAPKWGRSPSQLLLDRAETTKAEIEMANMVIEEMVPNGSIPGLGRNTGFNVRTG